MKNSLKFLITLTFILQGILSESVIDKDKLDKICSNVNPRDFEFNETMTIPEYIESIDLGEQSHSLLDTYLTTDKIPPIPDILREMFLVIVIGLFIIISVLTWLGFWICCCKKCCAFKRAKISHGKKCCTFIITVALFVITIAASIGAFATSTHFVGDLNSLTCSFAKFYYHTEFGEELSNETTSRWIGLEAIIKMAGDTQTEILALSEDTKTFEDIDKLNLIATDYYNDLNDLDKYGNLTIQSPNVENETYITPMYAFEFLYNKEELVPDETYLSKIRYEFNENIYKPVFLLNSLNEEVKALKLESKKIIGTMDEVQTKVTSLKDSVNNIGNKVFTAVYDYQDQANNLGLKFFRVLFGIFIGFAVVLLVILFLYSCTKCAIFKWLLFVVWNVLLIFMILAFTVAAIFEVFTEAAYQIAPATSHIFTEEFLKNNSKFQVSDESAELLEICLNGDGNIADKLNVDEESINAIDTLYKTMESLRQIGSVKTESEAIFDAQTGMQKYLEDYSLATSENNTSYYDRVSSQIDQINAWLTVAQCKNDNFSIIEGRCPENYTIVHSKKEYDDSTYHCMLVQNLEKDVFEEIYSEKIKSYPKLLEIFEALKNFYDNEQKQVNDIKGDLSTMDTKYNDTTTQSNDITIKANELSSGFLEVFEPIMSDGGFKEIFSCRFIKKDLMSFMDIIFHEFKDDCKAICIGTFVAALASYVGLYFLLITIYRHGKQKKKNDDDYEEM